MKMRQNSARRIGGDTRGDALTEFAFASTIFFVTVFGTIMFGIAVWRYNLIADLAQEGARWASVHGSTSAAPADGTSMTDYMNSRAIGMNLTQVTMSCGAASASLSSCDCDLGASAVTCIPSNIVQVTVQTSFTPGTLIIPHSTLTLQASAQMLVAR